MCACSPPRRRPATARPARSPRARRPSRSRTSNRPDRSRCARGSRHGHPGSPGWSTALDASCTSLAAAAPVARSHRSCRSRSARPRTPAPCVARARTWRCRAPRSAPAQSPHSAPGAARPPEATSHHRPSCANSVSTAVHGKRLGCEHDVEVLVPGVARRPRRNARARARRSSSATTYAGVPNSRASSIVSQPPTSRRPRSFRRLPRGSACESRSRRWPSLDYRLPASPPPSDACRLRRSLRPAARPPRRSPPPRRTIRPATRGRSPSARRSPAAARSARQAPPGCGG